MTTSISSSPLDSISSPTSSQPDPFCATLSSESGSFFSGVSFAGKKQSLTPLCRHIPKPPPKTEKPLIPVPPRDPKQSFSRLKPLSDELTGESAEVQQMVREMGGLSQSFSRDSYRASPRRIPTEHYFPH